MMGIGIGMFMACCWLPSGIGETRRLVGSQLAACYGTNQPCWISHSTSMGIGWTSSLSVNIAVVLPFMFIPLWPWFDYVSFHPLDSGWSIESIGYCWKVDRPRECQTWNHQAASNFKTSLMYTIKWNDWNYIKYFLYSNDYKCTFMYVYIVYYIHMYTILYIIYVWIINVLGIYIYSCSIYLGTMFRLKMPNHDAWQCQNWHRSLTARS